MHLAVDNLTTAFTIAATACIVVDRYSCFGGRIPHCRYSTADPDPHTPPAYWPHPCAPSTREPRPRSSRPSPRSVLHLA